MIISDARYKFVRMRLRRDTHPTMTRIRSESPYQTRQNYLILRGEVEAAGRIVKRHSTCDYAQGRMHRECLVSLLFKTSISADHL